MAESTCLPRISPLLVRTRDDTRPVVVMMCGLPASGKSTTSYAIMGAYPQFLHLSMDAIILERHGLYEIDYPPDLYSQYQSEAHSIFMDRYQHGLTQGHDMILDRSFYAKSDRDTYRHLADHHGARVVLLYFRPNNKECVWHRIEDRQAKRNELVGVKRGDAAYTFSREVFDSYWEGFEVPIDEDAVEVEVE